MGLIMKSIRSSIACLVTWLWVGCAAKHWEHPYPPVPAGKSAGEKPWFRNGDFRHDAVERMAANRPVFQTIDEEVDRTVKSHPNYGKFGFSHTWSEVKRRTLYWK